MTPADWTSLLRGAEPRPDPAKMLKMIDYMRPVGVSLYQLVGELYLQEIITLGERHVMLGLIEKFDLEKELSIGAYPEFVEELRKI